MFVDSEVGRLTNPSLFDVLEEKVLIFDEQSKEILYQNKAIEVGKTIQDNLSINTSHVTASAALLQDNFNEKVYALVEPKIFKATNVDPQKAIQKINQLNNFKSLTDIINKSVAKNYQVRKSTYKVNLKDL